MHLVLAPIADYTNAPFRFLCHEFGAQMAYTEMISSAALIHDHAKTALLLERLDGEAPLGCQIFGSNEDEVAGAASIIDKVKDRFVELNLNAGCPMPRILAADAGAKLTADPERTYRLLRAMKAETSLPVTLKTRLGPNHANTTLFELIDAAERAGAAAFILHARYASQKHGGQVHLDLLAEAVRRAHIPVVGNGNVDDAASAKAMAETGVAAIMIAREAYRRPWVFSEIMTGVALPHPEIRFKTALRHLELELKFRSELAARNPDVAIPSEDQIAAMLARTKLFRYFKDMPHVAAFRARIAASTSVDSLRETLANSVFKGPTP